MTSLAPTPTTSASVSPQPPSFLELPPSGAGSAASSANSSPRLLPVLPGHEMPPDEDFGLATDEEIVPGGSTLTGQQKKQQRRRAERKRRIRNALLLLQFGCAHHEVADLEKWSPARLLAKARELTGHQSISIDGNIWFINLDERVRSRGGFDPAKWKGRNPDLSEERLKSERWTLLNRGIIYGYRMNAGKKILVFAARFQPYEHMTTDEVEEMEFIAYHFAMLERLFRKVDNGSMRGGLMFAEGWRAGYEVLHRLGLYVLNQSGNGTPEEYARFILDMERVSNIYAKRYQALAPRQHLESRNFMEESSLPRFGTSEVDDQGASEAFGSNLTVTWGDFWNVCHCDDDTSPRAAGLWLNTDNHGNLIWDPKRIREAVQGGLFALPEYKLAIDFGACPGVVDVMWSSVTDLHATTRSITEPGFRRIGSSIQVPKSTADAKRNMAEMDPKDRPIAGLEIRKLELELQL
ncbi:hypothetical protein FRC08_011386 [Ceratobasidium sp. 394]|nr:hypothetical protein FRC08_011386 [Ceratobasidium sp. 394]